MMMFFLDADGHLVFGCHIRWRASTTYSAVLRFALSSIPSPFPISFRLSTSPLTLSIYPQIREPKPKCCYKTNICPLYLCDGYPADQMYVPTPRDFIPQTDHQSLSRPERHSGYSTATTPSGVWSTVISRCPSPLHATANVDAMHIRLHYIPNSQSPSSIKCISPYSYLS